MTEQTQAFDTQGHRGDRGLRPENTLAGFAHALSIGVNTIELDVGATRDNVLVVAHNPRLEPETTRDANGNWLTETGPAIRSLSLEELKSYDVGRLNPNSRYGDQFPEQVAVDGQRIPTLEEVLLLIKRSGNKQVRLNIETKLNPSEPELFLEPKTFAQNLLKVIKKHGFEKRVAIQSFDWRTLKETQQLDPEITTSYLTVQQNWHDNIQQDEPGPSPWTAGYDIDAYEGNIARMIKTAGGKVWSSYHQEMTAERVKQAHDLGLQVKVWTVNEIATMETMIDIGVDGIITDYPDRLHKVLEKRGMPTPTATPVTP